MRRKLDFPLQFLKEPVEYLSSDAGNGYACAEIIFFFFSIERIS